MQILGSVVLAEMRRDAPLIARGVLHAAEPITVVFNHGLQ